MKLPEDWSACERGNVWVSNDSLAYFKISIAITVSPKKALNVTI